MPVVPSRENSVVAGLPMNLGSLTSDEFLQYLKTLHIEIQVKGDKLSLNAPAGALTPDLQVQLRRRKSELLYLIKPHEQGHADEAAPLSFAQERLWLFDQLAPGQATYNIPQSWVIEGPLDRDLIERAIRLLLLRHAALRTRFEINNGRPVQVVEEHLPAVLDLVDLSPNPSLDLNLDPGLELRPDLSLNQDLPSANVTSQPKQDKQLAAILIADSQKPFSLVTGPLIRFRIFKLSLNRYVFSLNVHHIVADQRSLTVLKRDLAYIYSSLLAGGEVNLPTLPKDYVTFARETRSSHSMRLHSLQLEYWRERLRGMPTRLELPFSKTRPPAQTYIGSRYRQEIDAALTGKVRNLAKLANTSLYTLMLTIFSVLLYRYTGQKDLCIGTPISTRKRQDEEDMVGLFINMLPLRCSIAPANSFALLLQHFRERTLRDLENGDLPFQRIISELQQESSQSFSSFFQIMFALNSRSPEGDLEETEIEVGVAKVDLTLQIAEQSDTLQAYFEFRTDLFAPEDIRLLAQHYVALTESVVNDPKTEVRFLPLTTTADLQTLTAFNHTDLEYDHTETLLSLFQNQAKQTPQSIAVASSHVCWSFAELDSRSDLVAHLLRCKGVKRGDVVAISLERTPDLLAGQLGIMKVGAAYLPLDPKYPDERLTYMLRDSGARLAIVASRRIGERLSVTDASIRIVTSDEISSTSVSHVAAESAEQITSQDAAYIIYTSGSTGSPKGTLIEHRNAVALLRWAIDFFEKDALRRVLASTSICFDLSVFELFLPLATGNTIVLVDDVLQLAGSPHAQSVTLVNTVPSAMNALLERGLPASVHTVCLAGEFLSPDLVDRVYQAGAAQVFDLYGPTETTTYSTVALRTPDSAATIGSPIANTRIYLLDENRVPVPIGAIGEIYIAGDGVARGYHNRPELTCERFLTMPAIDARSRLYRTGDLARQLENGNLIYHGRRDNQVKLRGYRVELGEIEFALRDTCALDDLAVVLQPSSTGDRLVAFVGSAASRILEEAHWVDTLRKRLPAYMVPSLSLLDHPLPRTLNGKIDRKALASQDHQSTSPLIDPPSDLLEQWLANIFASCLKQTNIPRDAHFFDDLGGNSLVAFEIFVLIEKRLGVSMQLTRLFQSPTIEALAMSLRAQPWRQLECITMREPGAGSSVLYLFEDDQPIQLSSSQRSGRRVMAIPRSLRGNLRQVVEEIQLFEASRPTIALYSSSSTLLELNAFRQELSQAGFPEVLSSDPTL